MSTASAERAPAQRWRLPTGNARLVAFLMFGNALQTVGIQLFLPILPIYLHHRGATAATVGLVIGAGTAGFGLCQWPSGWIADRFDRKAIALLGMALYGAFYFVYLLPLPLGSLVFVRFLHAFSGGIYTPAAQAILAELTPIGRRTRVFGLWQSIGRAGLLVGPLLGGVIATIGLQLVFIGAGLLVLASALPLLKLPSGAEISAGAERAEASGPAPGLLRGLLSSIVAAGAPDYLVGTISAIWSIFLLARGAAPWEVGVCFSLFALPAVLLSSWIGGVADRRGARLVLRVSLVTTGLLAPLAAFFQSIPLLMLLICALGLSTAAGRPVVFAEASRTFGHERQAQAQGILQMGLLIAQTLGALVAGALFASGAGLSFAAVAVACFISLLATPFIRSAPVSPVAAPPPVTR